MKKSPTKQVEMIEILDIPQYILVDAIKRSKKLGRLHNSITKGAGNIIGYIGQALVARHLKAQDADTFEYDVVKDGIRYEVKSKSCTSKPRPDYDCSVSGANAEQECDYYVFVRVMQDFSKAWILGKKKPKKYFKEARFCKKGEKDEKSHLGWKFKGDCYNLDIASLDPI